MTDEKESYVQPDSKTVTMTVSVEGEKPYTVRQVIPDTHIELFVGDLLDHVLEDLSARLRQFRSLKIYGQCKVEGCSYPCTPTPIIADGKMCAGHDRFEFLSPSETTDGA